MDVWIGTSGYSYSDWGDFYPAEVPANRRLSFYARNFPLVELNFSFYRCPTAVMLARLGEQTPSGFQFVVKVPKTISHEQRLDDLTGFRHAVEELRRRGKLLGVLIQLPQSAHADTRNRTWVETLADALDGLNPAVEFRHYSWATQDVPPWLADRGLDLVSVDVPNVPALYPSGLVRSGPHVYVRLHSRRPGAWYASEKERYDYDYHDVELKEWVTAISESGAERALVLFNNCHHGHAPANARRMTELFGGEPHLHVVEPFASPLLVQRTLF